MSTIEGPNVTLSDLVFTYDMYNNRSFVGAPGTNILPTPGINGRFTLSNEWGTYNTNQYNGGQFFSIGTISSVTNNIVTTSGNHPFRTYDSVQPQTSGGGLTANTNYFIKKISDTQFSIHEYNSSQNGSQGYINTSTGNFKVYDSIALDQRISINSTSFPTMWWGYPHLPNTCHVKEIVTNGGYVPGTNCMRIHVTRTVGVDGGMAYGVYTPVTAGDVIVVSFWVRTPDPRGVGVSMSYTTYFGPSAGAYSNAVTLTTSWQKVAWTWTASATYSFYQYWFPPAASTPYDVDMADLQVQVNTGGIASTFVDGTRSNTQALLDISGNNTITASALTYANDNTFSFDGTNDYIAANWAGANTVAGGYNTVSMWMYWTGASNGFPMEFSSGYRLWMPNSNLGFNTGNGDCYGIDFTGNSNKWVHVVAVFYNGSYLNNKIYLNGVAQSLTQRQGSANSGTASTSGNIGGYAASPASYPFPGKLSYFTVHNRELSATEINFNFNAMRGKYGV